MWLTDWSGECAIRDKEIYKNNLWFLISRVMIVYIRNMGMCSFRDYLEYVVSVGNTLHNLRIKINVENVQIITWYDFNFHDHFLKINIEKTQSAYTYKCVNLHEKADVPVIFLC